MAARLRWRPLLALSYATAVAWTLSLALIDGWQRGVAGRLTTRHEYLHEVPGVTDIPAMLRDFTARILDFQPDSWTTHVAGHPPGALLVFVWLDRVGLGGGGWAGALLRRWLARSSRSPCRSRCGCSAPTRRRAPWCRSWCCSPGRSGSACPPTACSPG